MARLSQFGKDLTLADSFWNFMKFDTSHASDCQCSQKCLKLSSPEAQKPIPEGQVGRSGKVSFVLDSCWNYIIITTNFPKSGPIHHLPGHRNRFQMARLGQLCKVLSFFDSLRSFMKFDMSHANNCQYSQEWPNSSSFGAPEPVLNGQVGSIW